MRVGFYHQGEAEVPLRLATRMVASARRTMPDIEIVQFSDTASPAIIGVGTVERCDFFNEQPLPLRIVLAYSWFALGDWLLVDTDVEVRADVQGVFSDDFDVAVATREGTLLDKEVGTKFMAANAYNKGVVFSKSFQFWADVVRVTQEMSPKAQARATSDQIAMNQVIASERYDVQVLPNAYNYPPKWKFEDLKGKHIIHWKGPNRKKWALELAAERVA